MPLHYLASYEMELLPLLQGEAGRGFSHRLEKNSFLLIPAPETSGYSSLSPLVTRSRRRIGRGGSDGRGVSLRG